MMEDVGTLQKGFFSVLPCDRAGRAVIFFDRIRAIPAVASKDAVVRTVVAPNNCLGKTIAYAVFDRSNNVLLTINVW